MDALLSPLDHFKTFPENRQKSHHELNKTLNYVHRLQNTYIIIAKFTQRRSCTSHTQANILPITLLGKTE